MSKFKDGDRVQYVGRNMSSLIGLEGTVYNNERHDVPSGGRHVAWDGFKHGHGGRDSEDRKDIYYVTNDELFLLTSKAEDSRGGGLKYDAGKPQARLLHEGMPLALARVIDTLTFGAQKYAAHSWQTVPNALERYQDASYRHDSKRAQGEKLDEETKIHHRAHHIINELFLLELELRQEKADGTA